MLVLRSDASNGVVGAVYVKLEQGIHDSNFISLFQLSGQVERDSSSWNVRDFDVIV